MRTVPSRHHTEENKAILQLNIEQKWLGIIAGIIILKLEIYVLCS